MNLAPQLRLGLAAKLAICVVASTAAFFVLFGYVNLRIERGHSERLVEQSAERITDIILRSTRYQMMHNDREALHSMVRDVGSEPGAEERLKRSEKGWDKVLAGLKKLVEEEK